MRQEICGLALTLLVLGFIFFSLDVPYVSAEPESVPFTVLISRIYINPDHRGGEKYPDVFVQVEYFWWGEDDFVSVGDSLERLEEDVVGLIEPDPPYEFWHPVPADRVEIRITVWDLDNGKAGDEDNVNDRLDVASYKANAGVDVNVWYDLKIKTYWEDTVDGVSSGPDGSVWFVVFPAPTTITATISPLTVCRGETASIIGDLAPPDFWQIGWWDNVKKYHYKLGGMTIILNDTTDNDLIGIVDTLETASGGFYSITYTVPVDASFGTHVIEAKFKGDDNWLGSSQQTTICVIPWEGWAPTVESANAAGHKTDEFLIGLDDVYAVGSGFEENKPYTIYVVEHQTWTEGKEIPTPLIVKDITTDDSGSFSATLIWEKPHRLGRYDIVVDVDNDNKYYPCIDVLDADDFFNKWPGGFFVIPEVPFGVITSLIIMFTTLALFRKIHGPLKTK